MHDSHPIRSLLLSLTMAVTGAGAVLGLPSVTGGPAVAEAASVASAPSTAPAVEIVRARPPAALPPPAEEVLATQRAAGLDCHLTAQQVPVCLHGEDAEPRDRRFAAGGTGAGTPTSGRIGCYGTGTDGPRVQAVYVRPQSAADRYASSVGSIRAWAAGISSQVDASAARTGGRRHVRFATTRGSGCTVTVLNLALPDSAFRSFSATIDALEARGLTAASSKYLVWADAAGYCGIATTYADDRPTMDNLNNGQAPSYARIDRKCWGKVEAHELVHMLGGIQQSARNSTGGFHCSDGHDVMCYDDGTARSAQRSVCGKEGAGLLDCRNDDYFSTSAPVGSYLQTHWNTARSSFLAAALTDPPRPSTSTSAPRPSASPSASPSPSAPPLRLPALPLGNVVVKPLPTLPPPAADAVLQGVL